MIWFWYDLSIRFRYDFWYELRYDSGMKIQFAKSWAKSYQNPIDKSTNLGYKLDIWYGMDMIISADIFIIFHLFPQGFDTICRYDFDTILLRTARIHRRIVSNIESKIVSKSYRQIVSKSYHLILFSLIFTGFRYDLSIRFWYDFAQDGANSSQNRIEHRIKNRIKIVSTNRIKIVSFDTIFIDFHRVSIRFVDTILIRFCSGLRELIPEPYRTSNQKSYQQIVSNSYWNRKNKYILFSGPWLKNDVLKLATEKLNHDTSQRGCVSGCILRNTPILNWLVSDSFCKKLPV